MAVDGDRGQLAVAEDRKMFQAFGKSFNTVENLSRRLLLAFEENAGLLARGLSVEERRDIIAQLDDLGFFDLKDSVEVFADHACVSKVTIYTDIKKTRALKYKNTQ